MRRATHLTWILPLAVACGGAEEKSSKDKDSGRSDTAESDADMDSDADADADADADGGGDADDTGEPPGPVVLEGVGVTINASSLSMNCAPPTDADPLAGSLAVEIDNATSRDFELTFAAYVSIDPASAAPTSSRFNVDPGRWVVQGRTTVNLTLDKTDGFVASSPCGLCGKAMDLTLTATAADGHVATGTYSTSVSCSY